jgi:hypothetical protein
MILSLLWVRRTIGTSERRVGNGQVAPQGGHGSPDDSAAVTAETSRAAGTACQEVRAVPTDIESLLVLIIFIAPGFVATLVKNRLVPFSTPSPFRETLESVILSIFHAPVLIACSPIIARVRPSISAFLGGAGGVGFSEALWVVGLVILIFLGTAPLVGALYAVFLSSGVYPRIFARLAAAAGIFTKTGGAPEIWDVLFNRREQCWVTVRFKDGSGYYGLSGAVSVSPSDRQIYLIPAAIPTPTPSLYRFGPQGELLEDLTRLAADEKGVWIHITDGVAAIEISR